jgi:hypothetical protein
VEAVEHASGYRYPVVASKVKVVKQKDGCLWNSNFHVGQFHATTIARPGSCLDVATITFLFPWRLHVRTDTKTTKQRAASSEQRAASIAAARRGAALVTAYACPERSGIRTPC